MRQTIGEYFSIGIHHKDRLVEVRRYASDLPQAIEHLKFKLRHSLIEHDFLQERHENNLTVSLAAITWLGLHGLVRRTTFHNAHHGHSLLLVGRNCRIDAIVIKSGI